MTDPDTGSTRPSDQKANDDVLVTRLRRLRLSRRTTIVLATLAGLLVLGAGGVAWATYDYTNDYAGRLLPGAVVAGVDVGGMSPADAIEAVGEAIQPRLDAELTVRWEDRTWTANEYEYTTTSHAPHKGSCPWHGIFSLIIGVVAPHQ